MVDINLTTCSHNDDNINNDNIINEIISAKTLLVLVLLEIVQFNATCDIA